MGITTAQQLREAIENEIASAGDQLNGYVLLPQDGLVPPQRITVIVRLVENGTVRDELEEVWLVFVEGHQECDGYRIVASLDGSEFGLAGRGFPKDKHLVLIAWCGDFMSAFMSM